MPRSILVPLDGSPFAEHALPLALAVARRLGASIELVLVHEPSRFPHPSADLRTPDALIAVAVREHGDDYLRGAAERVREATEVPVATRLLEGPVAETLADEAAGVDAALVVMATHGRGGVSRMWLGSVADALIRRIETPLLLVRPLEGAAPGPVAHAFRRVLVPLDGSPFAEEIIEPAMALAGTEGVEYHLVQGVYYLNAVGISPEALVPPVPDYEVEEAPRYLEGVATGMRTRGAKVVTHVDVNEPPARALLRYVEEQKVDLVAMATHGRSGVRRLALGSVADKVLRASPVPVLLGHPGAVAASERSERTTDPAGPSGRRRYGAP
jgi:nucleotide-binding universal stress UspA family protein